MRLNKGKKLAFNTVTSVLYEVTAIVCGFILPRVILGSFGSNVNGLVNSISKFLAVISFLDLGVGQVIQSSLYKPLAEKDNYGISIIYSSGKRFFGRIGLILSIYIVVMIAVYPLMKLDEFDYLYTALLIAAMGINLFSQYYFGVVDRLLLNADQRGYLQYSAQIITLVLNTVACVIIIRLGAPIQLVKLTTSLIFLLRPIFLRWYVRKHYSIDRHVKYEGEPIKQKWNGLAQHVTAFVLRETDVIVLTVFSSLANVSIYSVYQMVVTGIDTLFASVTHGVRALLGEFWAKKDEVRLRRLFSKFEWAMHTGITFVFTCTGMLILQFVKVYTKGINDAEYWQPLFAALITLANAAYCLRLSYVSMAFAAGEYKNTQSCFFIAAGLNIVISVLAVFFFGLIGVAFGTLVAMGYQTVWLAIYNSKHLVKGSIKSFIKLLLTDALTAGLIIAATFWIKLGAINYLSWVVMAVEVAAIALVVTIIVNLIFYRKNLFDGVTTIISGLKKRMKKKGTET